MKQDELNGKRLTPAQAIARIREVRAERREARSKVATSLGSIMLATVKGTVKGPKGRFIGARTVLVNAQKGRKV
jgi:hypothetical protein